MKYFFRLIEFTGKQLTCPLKPNENVKCLEFQQNVGNIRRIVSSHLEANDI